MAVVTSAAIYNADGDKIRLIHAGCFTLVPNLIYALL